MAIDININSQILTYADITEFPATGSIKTIYIAEDSDFSYYWDGTGYVQLSGGGGGNQDLQSVTDNGATTTNSLTIDSANAYSLIAPTEIGTEDKNSGTYAYLGSTGVLGLKSGGYDSTLDNLEVNINGINLQIPDKASAGNYIIQTTEEKGNANGYASLDSGGKIPATQLPNSVMEFKGAWDASTNTPTLANGTGNAGDVYRCSVAGSVNFGAGAISFGVGDWVMYNGSIWQHSPATDAVTSVNGLTGAVTLTIPAAQIQSDWTQANTSALDYIKNKPSQLTALGYYAQYQDDQTQTAAASNVGYPMKFRQMDLSNEVTVVSDSRITFANGGVYNLQFSSQFQNTDTQLNDVTIWLRKNGTDVAGSSGYCSIPNKHGSVNGHTIVAWNYLIEVNANDYYEIVWSASSTQVTMQYYAAGNPPPSTASAIFTVTQQAGVMAETQLDRLHSFASPYDYNGHASQGSSESASVWTITRLTLASDGTTTKGVATGAWTNRASLIYS
jgi:hypothetical protein